MTTRELLRRRREEQVDVCPHTRLPRLPLRHLIHQFNSIQFNSIQFAQASRDARSSEESLRLKRVAASEARIRRAKRDDAFLERTHLDCFGQVGVCPYATRPYLQLHLRIHSIQSRRRNAAGALNAARKCATRCAPYMHTLARHVFTVTIA